MSNETTQYRPGDIVNGHQLSEDGATWLPLQPEDAAGPGEKEGRNWFARHKILTGVGAAAAAVIVIAAAAGGSERASDGSATADESVSAAAPAEGIAGDSEGEAPEEAADPAGIGDGIHRVGVDVQPGLYVATGSGYWERLSGASGEFDDIITNGNGSGGQVYVEIASTDQYFATSGFSDWVPVTDTEGANATTFSGDGMYRIGVDIQPGTYQATGSGYWERLSGASGEFDDIIANGNGSGNAIVTIDAGDQFFSTSGFSDWTPVQ